MTDPAASPEPQPPAASPAPAPAQPVEPLRPDEEALDDEQVMKLVAEHKLRLERMPDEVRPPAPGTSRPNWWRRTYVVDWKLQLSYAGLYIATITLFVVGFAAANLIYLRLIQWAKLNS